MQLQCGLTLHRSDTKHTDDWFKNQSTQELLSEAQRDRLFSGSPKLYENSEEQRVSKKPQSPKTHENREEQRVSKKPQSPKTHENREEHTAMLLF
ncbi:hypothetical protein TVAG_130690 [Trichomonas vaginalis G3]|uniref:Uncharacterized protein n=1 Tax=Trichomonas vaginalis (strain ATCC PRA-98 / G3) TaxID=412133 RepID=A2FTA4_TRIV3|nr:KilA, N-terminal/APSES-type HTH, DNA-binding family [Trichomonas vaginalis G3]EAX91856.1 hypothetical protein TVAG_130690 [Trichomonas vaginalis G3]KAI5506368.1 KilA, N-terminal/APSES-type HTH, DNA-binding family [Trichomonas vaginalis G3]|eukprot:XP_001304786.1 hypothetical protein [Trichomonas vaginalis G3]